jgi:hypothetical protein
MKLGDSILLSLSAAFLIIGIHQLVVKGLFHAYFYIMLAVLLLLWHRYRKK